MILYHGSDQMVMRPELRKGRPHNDYGRGFYCTQSLELAKEWACGKNTNGFANEYRLECDDLRILDLNGPEFSILTWLAVLARHRTYWQKGSIAEEAKRYIEREFLPDLTGCDLIRGYRADDSYFSFAQDFVSGAISLRKLQEAMHLGELGEQIVLKSERAFREIEFLRSIPANAEEYYAKKSMRDLQARRAYRAMRRETAATETIREIYIIDILREEMKADDPRLR